ncbi:Fe-S cluster assembly protein SufD [Beggiatoa alba]|nr:Fe-S cluster assembly protein SufD [Beggiatoa alba]
MMNSVYIEQQRNWFQQLISQVEPDMPGQTLPWLKDLRSDAKEAIRRLPVIQRKQEAWRYSNPERLFKQTFYPVKHQPNNYRHLDPKAVVSLCLDSLRLVFVDGHFVPDLSEIKHVPDGVIVGSIQMALNTHPALLSTVFKKTDPHSKHLFTALNTVLMNEGVFIYIGKNIKLEQPIEVLYLSTAMKKQDDANDINNDIENNSGNITSLRNIIVLDKDARANLIERYSSDENALYFNNNLIEISVNQGASLKHTCIQDESRSAFHMNSLFLSQYKKSFYEGLNISIGAAWSRADYQVNFKEPDAASEIKGLYTAGSNQLTDVHLDIKHNVPGCRSREQFKGILYAEGRTVFDGHVIVEKNAQHSDASMKNDNLILSENAQVVTKPQLEIYADDVKCSHGTTVGQLDEQQVFYLRSRGIEEVVAKKILCMGFANEILDAIELPMVREYVNNKLMGRLNSALSDITQNSSRQHA